MRQKSFSDALKETSTPWLKVSRTPSASLGDPLDIALGRRTLSGIGTVPAKGRAPVRPGVDFARATARLPDIAPIDQGTGGAVGVSRASASVRPQISWQIPARPELSVVGLRDLLRDSVVTPPRDLTEHQRLELMMPGLVWWVQTDSLRRQGADRVWCGELARAFAASAMEVLDDLPNDDAGWKYKCSLMETCRDVFVRVISPTDGTSIYAVLAACDLWMTSLLTTGILELHAETLFSDAWIGFNASILSVDRNVEKLAGLDGEAGKLAAGIQARFNKEGFYLK